MGHGMGVQEVRLNWLAVIDDVFDDDYDDDDYDDLVDDDVDDYDVLDDDVSKWGMEV